MYCTHEYKPFSIPCFQSFNKPLAWHIIIRVHIFIRSDSASSLMQFLTPIPIIPWFRTCIIAIKIKKTMKNEKIQHAYPPDLGDSRLVSVWGTGAHQPNIRADLWKYAKYLRQYEAYRYLRLLSEMEKSKTCRIEYGWWTKFWSFINDISFRLLGLLCLCKKNKKNNKMCAAHIQFLLSVSRFYGNWCGIVAEL